jgi:hypothetical protein
MLHANNFRRTRTGPTDGANESVKETTGQQARTSRHRARSFNLLEVITMNLIVVVPDEFEKLSKRSGLLRYCVLIEKLRTNDTSELVDDAKLDSSH